MTNSDSIRIVRAAIQDDCGGIWSVPIPQRHHDVIALMRQSSYEGSVKRQGFLLSDGMFMNREDSYVIAKAAGQLRKEKLIGSKLTTEDLW